jgi:molybdate transport system substrate-binding protein
LRVKSFFVIALALLLLAPHTWAANLKIAAAANLEKVLTQALIPAFQRQTGAMVTPTFGSTKLLATQLRNGAPEDIFMSADTVTTDQLAAQGVLVPNSKRVYAIGQLVIWSRADAAHHPHRFQDLASPLYAKIAIANPLLAPYGLAAQQSFAKAGLTATVAPRLVTAENIGQCLQFAQSGNANVALTALALVIGDKSDPYIIVPEKLHAPIAQSLGIVKTSTEPALARRFTEFLTSKTAAAIWKRYGYDLPRK